MHRRPAPLSPRHHGVSLVEALVALAVMSFGMLALIGVQGTMRINTDLSRQTTEATRIASEDLESLRLFVDVRTRENQPVPSWDDLADRAESVQLPGNTGNVTFDLARSLVVFPTRPDKMAQLGITASQAKIAQTAVTWTDRTDMLRTVRMQGVVAAAAPVLSGMVSLPRRADAPALINNRHPTIPAAARDLGNGRSAYKPSTLSTVVWVFNNVTGFISNRCPSITAAQTEITAEMTAECPAIGNGRLLAGTVRFHLAAPPSGGYTASVAENPQGAPGGETLALGSTPLSVQSTDRVGLDSPYMECFNGAAYDPAGGTPPVRSAIDYQCLMYMTDTDGWGGKVDLSVAISGWSLSSSLTADSSEQKYRVCRYTRATSDFTANRDHPKTYCKPTSSSTCTASTRVNKNLTHQNFLVLHAKGLCPTDSDNNDASGQDALVNANTRAHQPS